MTNEREISPWMIAAEAAVRAVAYVAPTARDADTGLSAREEQTDVESYDAELLCRDGAERELADYNAALNARAAVRAVLDEAGVTREAEGRWSEHDAFGVRTARIGLPGGLAVEARVRPGDLDLAEVAVLRWSSADRRMREVTAGDWHSYGGLDGDGGYVADYLCTHLQLAEDAERLAVVARCAAEFAS